MINYNVIGYNQKLDLNTLENPLYLYLELTNFCNMKCKFCSVTNKENKFIDMKLLYRVFEEMKKNNIYDIYYTGGEPLLHPNFSEIVNLAYSYGIRQTVLTNGLLLNKYEKILNKLECICVSLHGSEETHNSIVGQKCYNQIIKNILLAKKYTNLNINYTVISENQDHRNILNVLKFGKDNNIKISFSKFNNIGDGKKNNCNIDINSFIEIMDLFYRNGYKFSINDCIPSCLVNDNYAYLTHGCGAGYMFGSIDIFGNVKICPSSLKVHGNIFEHSFKRIWNNNQLKKYRSFDWIPVSCKNCKNLSKCRCGCKVELGKNIDEFNDYLVTEEKNNIWNSIKNKKMKVQISLLRKENDGYISLSNPPRKFNKDAVILIKKLNEGCIVNDLESYKEFIISLYKDGIIKEDEKNA